jgi:hypothetical protein
MVGDRRLNAVLAPLLALTLFLPATARAEPAPVVTLGDNPNGAGELALFDREGRVLRRFVGLDEPTDLAPATPGRYLLVDRARCRLAEFDLDGVVTWS